jgi:hypothetical protein
VSSAVRVAITSFSWMPSKLRISPANRKVSPGLSDSMKYSSILPSARPGRPANAAATFRATRTLRSGASMIVPTFSGIAGRSADASAARVPSAPFLILAKRS